VPHLTDRYTRALDLARVLHGADVRKGTTIPYLTHLMSVSALVLEHGGDEDQAIAALLHDAGEDHGGELRIEAIKAEFGERVARIVADCSDSLTEDRHAKAPWSERKARYISHLSGHVHDESLVVSAADKLHNGRAILADHRRDGERVWRKFNADADWDGTYWYYTRLVEVLGRRLEGDRAAALVDELSRVVDELGTRLRAEHPDLDERLAARRAVEASFAG
jgi:(p)ppGpp synthase/HD superfamily hydrolase